MAEQRLERDLRAALAADLDPVHGPDPRWADAPVARRIAAGRGAPSRWRTAALLVAAGVGVVAIAILAVASRDVPVATAPPVTIEPWPSAVAPDATPTTGEIALGRVAVATAYGEPALLVRVSRAAVLLGGSVGNGVDVPVTIEVRIIGPLDRDFGIDRFVVVRTGRAEAPGLGVTAPDPLAIAADAPVGTEVSTTVVISAIEREHVDLGYAGSGTSIVFRYPIHRSPVPPSMEGRCPTLEDYAIASLQPSIAAARPSFDPVAPGTTPSTGFLQPGEAGIVPAPDGSPGALVRVSNIRFCERLPDYRPDAAGWDGDAQILLADVEIETLAAGTFDEGFIPGAAIVVASYGGHVDLESLRPFNGPGGRMPAVLDTGPGLRARGTIAWVVPDDEIRLTLDVQRAGTDESGRRPVQFSYLAREGTDYDYSPPPPEPTSDPAAPPTTGTARVGESVVLEADGGTVPLVVDGIVEVPRYPGLAPSPGAGGFLEVRLRFGEASGSLVFDPAEWVVVGPAGEVLPEVEQPSQGNGCNALPGWPNVARCGDGRVVVPDWWFPVFIVAEVPTSGRVTLEYQFAGGPALVTWILRDQ